MVYAKEPMTLAIDGRNTKKPVIKKNTIAVISTISRFPPDNLPPSLTHCFLSFLLCIVDFLFLGHVFKQSCEERVKYRLLAKLKRVGGKKMGRGYLETYINSRQPVIHNLLHKLKNIVPNFCSN
jgi:hypothetical protein